MFQMQIHKLEVLFQGQEIFCCPVLCSPRTSCASHRHVIQSIYQHLSCNFCTHFDRLQQLIHHQQRKANQAIHRSNIGTSEIFAVYLLSHSLILRVQTPVLPLCMVALVFYIYSFLDTGFALAFQKLLNCFNCWQNDSPLRPIFLRICPSPVKLGDGYSSTASKTLPQTQPPWYTACHMQS